MNKRERARHVVGEAPQREPTAATAAPVYAALMPMGSVLKRALYEALSTETLRRAAAHAEMRDREALTREEIIEGFAGRTDDSDVLSLSWQLTESELRAIAAALSIDVRGMSRRDDLRLALFTFVDFHSASEERRRARRAQLRPVSMSTEALIGIGEELARPVTHLRPSGDGRPVAVWHEESFEQSEDSPQLWLSLDLRAHPLVASDEVLELSVSPGSAEAYVSSRGGSLPELAPGLTPLYAHEARDLPTLDVIFLRGAEPVGTWLRENEWDRTWGYNDNFPDAEVARAYQRVLDAEHPLLTDGVWAQLGGWPMTWPDEEVQSRIDDPLILRTYRGSEPWVEVFLHDGQWLVRTRIT